MVNNISGIDTMLLKKVKVFIIIISVLLSLMFLLMVILGTYIFEPIFRTNDLNIEVKGKLMPVAYKGIIKREPVYFIFDKNQDKLFLFRQGFLTIRPNVKAVSIDVFGSVKNILGIKLRYRDSGFGIRIDEPLKVGEERPVWGNDTVSFKFSGDEFKITFKEKSKNRG